MSLHYLVNLASNLYRREALRQFLCWSEPRCRLRLKLHLTRQIVSSTYSPTQCRPGRPWIERSRRKWKLNKKSISGSRLWWLWFLRRTLLSGFHLETVQRITERWTRKLLSERRKRHFSAPLSASWIWRAWIGIQLKELRSIDGIVSRSRCFHLSAQLSPLRTSCLQHPRWKTMPIANWWCLRWWCNTESWLPCLSLASLSRLWILICAPGASMRSHRLTLIALESSPSPWGTLSRRCGPR